MCCEGQGADIYLGLTVEERDRKKRELKTRRRKVKEEVGAKTKRDRETWVVP